LGVFHWPRHHTTSGKTTTSRRMPTRSRRALGKGFLAAPLLLLVRVGALDVRPGEIQARRALFVAGVPQLAEPEPARAVPLHLDAESLFDRASSTVRPAPSTNGTNPPRTDPSVDAHASEIADPLAGSSLFVEERPVEAAFIAMGWALLSASALLIGAYTAMYWDPGPVTLSVMMAFGGGALVEALSIELFGHVRMLQRQGEPYVMWVAIVAAALGGLLYYGLEQLLNNRGAFLRSKFYLTSTIQKHHDALRAQAAEWELDFKRAWVREHARPPPHLVHGGDDFISELTAAQATAAGSAAAAAVQMAVDAGQSQEIAIVAGEAAGKAAGSAAGLTEAGSEAATAAGEAAGVAVQRAADAGQSAAAVEAAGRAAGEAAARGLTTLEAEAAGDAAAGGLVAAQAAAAGTAAAAAVRKAVKAGLPSSVAVAAGRAAGDAAAKGMTAVQPIAAGEAAAVAVQRAADAGQQTTMVEAMVGGARAAGEAAASGLTPIEAAAAGDAAAEAVQEAVDAGQPAAVADAAGRAAGEAAAKGLTAAQASVAGNVAAEAAQRATEAGQSSEAALAAGRAAGAVASKGLTEAQLSAHAARAHTGKVGAPRVPALSSGPSGKSLGRVEFVDDDASSDSPDEGRFEIGKESPRIALVRDLGLDDISVSGGNVRGDSTPGSRVTVQSSTASLFDTERGRSAAMAIWLGILLDGIPESLVLGIMSNEATDLKNPGLMYSLTLSVLISNFPEALASAATMKRCGMSYTTILLLWWSNFLLSGAGAFVGSLLFPPGKASAMTHLVQSGIEGMCGGAILVMVSNTVFPEAFEKGGGGIGLASLAGFLLAFTVGI
jgi:zinc transporter ZupT